MPLDQPLEPVHPNTTLGNDQTARAPDGTLTQPTTTNSTQPTAETTTTTEQKPTVEAKPESKPDDKTKGPSESLLSKEVKPDEKKEGEAPAGAPEKYEAFTAPEGFEIDAKVIEEVSPLFKELNLSQDQAQKLVDVYAKNVQKVVEEPFAAYETMREGWRKEVAADPELWSGEGLRPEVNATIGRALDQLDVGRKPGEPSLAESFKQAMNITGGGDHPAFVKAFYRMAKSFTEGRPVTQIKPSTAPQPGQRAAAPGPAALFPNLPSQSQTG